MASNDIGWYEDAHNGKAVQVSVEQGIIQGEQLMTVTRDTLYSSFKGIPYAAPPVGDLRFQPPKPPACWEGVRNAKQHGNICTQIEFSTQAYLPSSEDCLYLNVYTPNVKPSSPMAVMVFIHGGGYQSGSGNDDNFGPDFFMSQNVVLVTINYRLDAIGYLCLGSKEIPGNAGMKDQVAALKWVQRNIAQFGGNPKKITIFGTTTGGISCLLHAISPMSKGLFSRVIAMTGVPLLDISEEFESVRRGFTLGKMGYETENTSALFEFFQNQPSYKLVNAKPDVIIAERYIRNLGKMFQFGPVPEKDFGQERFLKYSPLTSLKERNVNDVDIMIGYSNNEAIARISFFEEFLVGAYNRYPELLNPRKFLYDLSPVEYMPLADFIEDHYFRGKAISLETMSEFVTHQSDRFKFQVLRYMRDVYFSYEKNKYLYRFSGVSERNVYSRLGANYGLTGTGQRDIEMYLFHANRLNLTIDTSSDSYRIIKQITTLFANYAKYGNPTPEPVSGVRWDQYNAATQSFLDIGLRLTRGVGPEPKVIKFWKKIYKLAGVPFYNLEDEEE
ncbi:venom carboxylesterase-6-like [Bicyclus anynana]|uniref:Venom carboxylesterase-6-like n=1 Tax=Bicyclus anynana TaxID=110368 RepID=A0A6J1PA29_BICAN|nr:venom carboxylesterase-6-like [Bicyclus anynana]